MNRRYSIKKFLFPVFFLVICYCIHAQDYRNRVLSNEVQSCSIDSTAPIPFTSRPDTGFVGVYELAPDTFLMTFECSLSGISSPTLFDSIFSVISATESFFPPKDMDRMNLCGSTKLTKSFKQYFREYYYLYGAKGYAKCKVGTALYYSGPCVCFYGLMLDGYDKTKYGPALFTYPSELPVSYAGDYTKIQNLLNEYKKIVIEDATGAYPYEDKIYPVVFANIGTRYFVYSDTFGSGGCLFPERMIYDMPNDGKHLTLTWYSEPDFFGIPCG